MLRSVLFSYKADLGGKRQSFFSLKKYLRSYRHDNVSALEILQLPMRDTYQYHWSYTAVKVPNGNAKHKDVHLPGRYMLLLFKAAMFSIYQGIPNLAIGLTKKQLELEKGNDLTSQVRNLLANSMDAEFDIIAPFAKKSREEVLYGMKDGESAYGFSCILPKGYSHCNDCFKCQERKTSFYKTGITDKTHYFRSHAVAALV